MHVSITIYTLIKFYLNLILSYLILSYLILSYLILSYLILSYLILSYLILSYLILSYLILSIYLKFQRDLVNEGIDNQGVTMPLLLKKM